MRKGIGISCILLGLLCLMIAVGFAFYNRKEANDGEKTSQALLQSVQENIRETELPSASQPEQTQPEAVSKPVKQQMPTVPAGNYESIGILAIPVLKLELPVLTDWNYEKLKKAPCHYFGSYYEPDFVIAAHNYNSHFGRLTQLQPGDLVTFTDVAGQVYCYEVVLLETLPATATEEMISSGFDLSLYTCTPGGGNRVTVRCRSIKP